MTAYVIYQWRRAGKQAAVAWHTSDDYTGAPASTARTSYREWLAVPVCAGTTITLPSC
jgi:hypothetical protein